MINSCDSAELAAAINAAASVMAKGKTIEEIEMLSIMFDLLSDTLDSIACLERKQEHFRRRREEDRLRHDGRFRHGETLRHDDIR